MLIRAYATNDQIRKRISELKSKIQSTKDYFLIYGYAKEIEELEHQLRITS